MVNVDLNVSQVVALQSGGQMKKEDLKKLLETFEKEDLIDFILEDDETDLFEDSDDGEVF